MNLGVCSHNLVVPGIRYRREFGILNLGLIGAAVWVRIKGGCRTTFRGGLFGGRLADPWNQYQPTEEDQAKRSVYLDETMLTILFGANP